MQMRLGQGKTQAFGKDFHERFALVEEANMITQEMRPDDNLWFCIEVFVDLSKYLTDEPDCGVRLRKLPEKGRIKKSERQQDSIGNGFSAIARNTSRPSLAEDPLDDTTVGVFGRRAFKVRLEHLREV